MGEIARIVHFSDQMCRCGDSAGGEYAVICVLPHRNVYRIHVFLFLNPLGLYIDQNPVRVDPADFLVPVSCRLREDTDQTALFQSADVACEGAVGDIQCGGDFVQVHLRVLQKKPDDLDAQIRSESFVQFNSIFDFFNM